MFMTTNVHSTLQTSGPTKGEFILELIMTIVCETEGAKNHNIMATACNDKGLKSIVYHLGNIGAEIWLD